MITQPASDGRGITSPSPAWGLKEQLGRLRKDHGGASSEGTQDRPGQPSKIRISVTGPALAHKIKEVRGIVRVRDLPAECIIAGSFALGRH